MKAPAISGRSIYDRAQELAFPRYPGTVGDRRAIEIVRSWFEAAELEVREEGFSYDVRPAFRALRVLLLGCAALIAASALAAPDRPGVALALVTAAVLGGGVFLSWVPWLETIYRLDGPTQTVNVVGTRRARTPGSSPPVATLILMAHHDSKSQSLTLPWRAGATLAAIFGVLVLAGVELSAVFGAAMSTAVLFVPASVACAALALLATLRSGNLSPGGVDNAGAVAILAELAKNLTAEVSDEIELLFLSPGAEEDHMVGAMRWLDRHAGELRGRPVFAVNIDGAGIPGPVVLLERYGLGRRFSARMSAVARAAAAEFDMKVRGALLPPGMGVDAIPFAHRGIESLTLASGSLSPAVLAVHSRHDRGENLEPRALADVAVLARAIILHLAKVARPQADSNSAQAAPAGSRIKA